MIVCADSRSIPLANRSVQMVVTSPPYWGLRDYGTGTWAGGNQNCNHDAAKIKGRADYGFSDASIVQRDNPHAGYTRYGATCPTCGAVRVDHQIGLEVTLDEYVQSMVEVFWELWRVLRDDGTVWLNLGDSYSGDKSGGRNDTETMYGPESQQLAANGNHLDCSSGLKPKNLCGVPWRVAFALQDDGWTLRADIIWAKPNPMPESVTDRPTRSHEHLFLFTKGERYFYDADAIREIAVEGTDLGLLRGRNAGADDMVSWHAQSILERQQNGVDSRNAGDGYRNKRDVWTVNSEPTPEAHFATFPSKLIEPCILAGTSDKGCCAVCGAPRVRVTERESSGVRNGNSGERGDHPSDFRTFNQPPQQSSRVVSVTTLGWEPSCEHDAPSVPCIVLDPFLGSGTTGRVASRLGRRWVGLELKQDYIKIAERRTAQLSFTFLKGESYGDDESVGKQAGAGSAVPPSGERESSDTDGGL